MAQHERNTGVWIVTTGDGRIIPQSSEINALRAAVSTNGTCEFVAYGTALGEESPPPKSKPAPRASRTRVAPEPTPEQAPEPESTPEPSDGTQGESSGEDEF